MSEYPEDVMKAARECTDLCLYTTDDRMAVHIARALMAERERCAAVGYWVCAETRHVTLGDKVRGAINQPSSAAPASPWLHPSEREPDQHPCS